jgi:hypothetical protein
MMKLNKVEIVNNKKRYYYDINIPNNITTNPSNTQVNAIFSETRDQPLFDEPPENFILSVVRFTVPSSTIPIQIIQVIPDLINPTNPNKMTYSVSLKYLGNIYTQNLEWIPQDLGVPIPQPPQIPQLKNEKYYAYYSLFSYNHFSTLLNNALNLLMTTYIIPLLPAPPLGTVYTSPYFTFDSINNVYTLWTSGLFLDTAVNPINVGGNYNLGSIGFGSFDVSGFGYNLASGLDFKFNILFRGNNKEILTTDSTGFIYNMSSEYDITGQFEKFESLLMTSSTLPITHSILSNSVIADASSSQGSVAGGFLPIITDFEIDKSSINNLRSFIHYNPTAEYRRVNLRGKQPINNININVYWKDTFGNIFDLIIPFNSSITIKILFEEK